MDLHETDLFDLFDKISYIMRPKLAILFFPLDPASNINPRLGMAADHIFDIPSTSRQTEGWLEPPLV
jgi:hypothetical protein